jgi:hypothetical protein
MAADRESTPRRFEPWPWLVTGLLVSMIGASLTFLAIAIQNPDPVVSGSISAPPEPDAPESSR